MQFSSSRIIDNIFSEEIPSKDQSLFDQLSNDGELFDNFDVYSPKQPTPSIQILIQINNETTAALQVTQNDDPYILAQKFCYDNSIDPKIISVLAKNIIKTQNKQFNKYGALSKKIYDQNGSSEANKQNISRCVNQRSHELENKKCNRDYLNDLTGKHNTFVMDHQSTYDDCNQVTALSKTSVFDRLYNDSKRKTQIQQPQQNNKSTSRVSLSSSCSHQVKIYEKNMKLKQSTLKKNQTIKQYIESMQQTATSHIPEINPVSRLIAEKLQTSDRYPSSKSREKSIRKTVEYLKEKEIKIYGECTFKPKIIKKKSNKNLNHQEKQTRDRNLPQRQQQKPQNPQINEVSRKIVGNKSFELRMKCYEEKSKEKKMRILAEDKNLYKFKPEINKPKTTRVQQNSFMRSFDRLYNHSKTRNKYVGLEPKSKNKFTNKISNQIYEDNKKTAFRYLFTLMDSDQDGLISSLKINIGDLTTEVLNMLAPLLCQMEDVGAELDEEQFVQSMERLFKIFTIQQKNTILNSYKNPLRKQTNSKKIDKNCFQPTLNEKSRELVRSGRQSSLYELGRQNQMKKQSKLLEMKKLKQLLEQQQCTFQPNLFYHHT